MIQKFHERSKYRKMFKTQIQPDVEILENTNQSIAVKPGLKEDLHEVQEPGSRVPGPKFPGISCIKSNICLEMAKCLSTSKQNENHKNQPFLFLDLMVSIAYSLCLS